MLSHFSARNNIKLKTERYISMSNIFKMNHYENLESINKLRKYLENKPTIIYLKKPGVLEWVLGNNVFTQNLTKSSEDRWGKQTIGYATGQWTTKLGESILKEILFLLNKNPSRVRAPVKSVNGKRLVPDFEADDGMYENKARTYTTTGTAGEKILGTPLKYCEIPRLYKKSLYIVCMAYQEREAEHAFHLFDPKSEELKEILADLENKYQIKYIRASDLLKQILLNDDFEVD